MLTEILTVIAWAIIIPPLIIILLGALAEILGL